jgi:hypothetical protein
VRAGERHDRRRHRGREQHRLAQLRRLGEQPLDVGKEAEVEHLVGLVEHQHLDVREVQRAAVGQVEQPPRRADHHVDAGLQGLQLRLVRDAAVDGERAGAALAGGDGDVAGHLEGELTGRRDDQRLRLAGRASSTYSGSWGATMRCRAGMANARVLPVPVRAWPIMSVPSRAMGSVSSWIGKASVMPTSASESAISGRTPRSWKVVRIFSFRRVWVGHSLSARLTPRHAVPT